MKLPYGIGSFLALVLFRLVCMFFCLAMSLLHYLFGNNTVAAAALELKDPGVATSTFGILFVLHTYGLGSMGLSYFKPYRRIHASDKKEPAELPKNFAARVLTLIWLKVKKFYDDNLSAKGLLGRRGRMYEVRLVAREAIEIPSQSYQAYLMSFHLTRWWSVMYALIIVVDILLIPIILRLKKIKTLSRRNFVLLLDAIVDTFLGAIYPLLVVVPPSMEYFADLNRATDYSWAAGTISALRFLLCVSMFDTFVTAIPLISSLLLFRTIHRNLIDINRGKAESITQSSSKGTSSGKIKPEVIESVEKAKWKGSRWISIQIEKVFEITAAIWAIVLLVCVIVSSTRTNCESLMSKVGCELLINPWTWHFEGSCQCLSYVLNCDNTIQLGYKKDNMQNEFQSLLSNELSNDLLSISVYNCPIQLPPKEMSKFEHVKFITFSRCNISQFDLPLQQFTGLFALKLIGNHIGTVPETFQHISPSIYFLAFEEENISELPPWIDSSWQSLYALSLRENELGQVPMHIFNLPHLHIVNLDKNGITNLPESLSTISRLTYLRLGGNQITSIPPSFKNLPKLNIITLAENNIQTLGDLPWNATKIQNWPTWPNGLLTLSGNPICTKEPSISNSFACKTPCLPLCDSDFEQNYRCDSFCNGPSCNYDRGFCQQPHS